MRVISLAALSALTARGVIFFGTADPEHNTTAPAGAYADSGWELQGHWGFYQGTPIGPRHFITSSHLGGAVGDRFQFRGANYTTVTTTKDPESDLQIWEVAGTFPAFAELFDGPSENAQEIVFFGRGFVRGEEARAGSPLPSLKGWIWGVWDGRLRWGRNVVSELVSQQGQTVTLAPMLIKATFDATAGDEEAHLAGGDSGGGMFIKQGATWKLAGVNYTVDGPFNSSASGSGFNAALFDVGGLFTGGEGNWRQILDTPLDQPSSLYATRVKVRSAWISGVLAQAATPLVVGSPNASGPYTNVAGAIVDTAAKTIRVPITSGNYFQLQSASALLITSARVDGPTIILQYEYD